MKVLVQTGVMLTAGSFSLIGGNGARDACNCNHDYRNGNDAAAWNVARKPRPKQVELFFDRDAPEMGHEQSRIGHRISEIEVE